MAKRESGRILSGKYEVKYTSRFEKNVNNLIQSDQNLYERLEQAVEEISNNPFSGDLVKKWKKQRIRKYRVGNFRIIYRLDSAERLVYLLHFRRRDSAYL